MNKVCIMYILIGALFIIIAVLIALLWKLKRQIQEICRQLSFLNEQDSNLMISREINFCGIGNLTNCLNELLERRKEEHKKYLEKEKIIAQTYTSLSHDIRTPLTSLDGYFQLLMESSDLNEQKRYFAVIQTRIVFLKEMLEELFTFTKLKNEEYQLELSEICINRVLKETLFSYYEDWKEAGMEPSFDLTEELLYIEGNMEGLKRVIQNIIKNVLEHGQRQIKVTLCQDGEELHLCVGNRVSEDADIDVTQAFERFYKADKARSRTTSGLGLSIAKEFVLRMNGRIRAELEGDMFWIRIAFPCLKIDKIHKKEL